MRVALLAAALLSASLVARAQPAADAPAPLPNVCAVMLVPAASVKTPDRHLGALVAVLLEQALLQSGSVNVITQGAQLEILEDLGVELGGKLDDATVARLGKLAGASHVVHGTFAPAKGGAFAWKVRLLDAATGKHAELATLTGGAADALGKVTAALASALAVAPWTPPALPATPAAQAGFVRCVAFAAVAAERAAVKGRDVEVPPNVKAACDDAAADPANPPGRGVMLATRVLSGDRAAAKELDEHVRAFPADRTALLAWVRLAFDEGRRDQAMQLLGTLRTARPRDPDVLRMVGELHMQAQRWPDAKAAFAQAVAEVPQSPYLRYRLSYATYRAAEPADALAHARTALELAGGDAPFYQLNLGERLLDAGQLDEAVKRLARSVEQTPRRLTPRVRLGYAYVLRKEADAALKVLKDAEKLPATPREVQRGIPGLLVIDLARAHAIKGNNVNALRYLEQAKKDGVLELVDLRSSEFDGMKDLPGFQKLRGE